MFITGANEDAGRASQAAKINISLLVVAGSSRLFLFHSEHVAKYFAIGHL